MRAMTALAMAQARDDEYELLDETWPRMKDGEGEGEEGPDRAQNAHVEVEWEQVIENRSRG